MYNPCSQRATCSAVAALLAMLLLQLFGLQQSASAQSLQSISKLKLKEAAASQKIEQLRPSRRFLQQSSTTVRLWDGQGELGKEQFRTLPEVRIHLGSESAASRLEKWMVSWSTEQTGFTKVLYQVSMFPFPSGFKNWQSPPGILKTGTVEKWSGTGEQPIFTIDLSTIFSGSGLTTTKILKTIQQKKNLSLQQPQTLKKNSLKKAVDLQPSKPKLQQSNLKPRFTAATEAPRAFSIYVRIITLNNAKNLVAAPSEPAVMHLSTPGDSQFAWYGDPNPNPEQVELHAPEIRILSYKHYQPYLSDWSRNFIVTKDMPVFGYSKGDKIFIPRDDGTRSGWEAVTGAIGDLAGFVADCVNRVSDAYNSLKQKALNLAISLAKNTVGCGSTCQNAFSFGLNYGLVVMGMPPSLPNFDEMMSMGKDYLIAKIAAETSLYLSEDDVAQAINYLESEVRKTADNGSSGNQWLRLNPDFQYHDAVLLLEVSNPTPTKTDQITCRINQFRKAFYFPFEPKEYYISIPPVNPGDTIQVPVMLRPNNVQCNNGKGMLMSDWNRMMENGVLLQVYPGKNEQILVKQ